MNQKNLISTKKSDQIGGFCPHLIHSMEKFPLIKNSFTLCWVKIAFNWLWLKTDDWQKKFSLEIWKSGNCDFLFLGIINVARPGSFICLNNFFKMFFDNFSSNYFISGIFVVEKTSMNNEKTGVQGKNNVYHIFFKITFFRFLSFFRCESSYYEEKIEKFYLQVNYFKRVKTTYMHFCREIQGKNNVVYTFLQGNTRQKQRICMNAIKILKCLEICNHNWLNSSFIALIDP